MKNPIFKNPHSESAKGYSSFPMDNLANFTSIAGYLLPVYWDLLEPGDKVTCQTLLRTRTQPLTKPAMATCIERLEWFAVPIDQIFKLFGSKFYGINDVGSDLLPINGFDSYLPFVALDSLNSELKLLPTSFVVQSSLPSSIPTYAEAKRLCDCLGLPKDLGNIPDTGYTFAASINVLPFCAYHKIYYDHYRLTDREENDPEYYNVDSFFGNSSISSAITSQSRIRKFLTLHKRPYMKDVFTSMLTSPVFGSQSVNASGSDLGQLSSWLNGLSRVATGSPVGVGTLGNVNINTANPTTVRLPHISQTQVDYNGMASAFNPANIRALFAVEKLLEVTRRAKKHYDMQTLAHFGVEVPQGISGECFKLGTYEQYLKIGDVISNAETDGAALGQLAGQGSSEGRSNKVHFEAKSHCVLMCIYSAEPVVNYGNDKLPRLFTQVSAADFYKSEFDNLGMQPVFMQELYCSGVGNSSVTQPSTVVGWQYRYYQSKSKYNRSFAGCSSNSFKEWCLNKKSIGSTSQLSRNFFYVWPTDLNDILQLQYTGSFNIGSDVYSEDYFINQVYFDVIKSSKKSIYGVPNL